MCIVFVITFLFAGFIQMPKVNAKDGIPNQDISDSLSNISVNIVHTDSDIVCVNNNLGVNPLYNNQHYTVEINWEIEANKYDNHVEPGDYFWLDISNSYFSFSNSISESPLKYDNGTGEKTIGYWKIENNRIYCRFSDDCTFFTQVSGYFEATGTFYSSNQSTTTITLGGKDIEVSMNPPRTGFPFAGTGSPTWNGGPLSKLGTHYQGDDYLGWSLYVNFDNAIKVANNITPSPLNNVIVRDDLPDDLIVNNVLFLTPINHPKDEYSLSSQSAFKLDLTSQMTRKDESEFSSSTEWEEYINTHAKTYGVSLNNKTLIANLGNLPGSLHMANDKAAFRTLLTTNYNNFSEDELNALVDIYYDTNTSSYPVYAVQVYIKSKSNSSSGAFAKDSYTNSATLESDSVDTNASDYLEVENVDAGIQGITPKTAALIKKDADTGEVISGASFKLQVLTNSNWTDYTPTSGDAIRVTDSNGMVTFENLETGTYRFIETEAAASYDINSVIYSADSFTVAISDIQGHEITATNAKLADDDDNPNGNNPDGNDPDGNNPDGNNPDGNNPDGNDPDGNNPDGNDPDGNNPDGNNPDGNDPDGNDPDGNNPDGNDPDGNDPDGNNPDGNDPDGNDPDGNNPDGNDPDGGEPEDDTIVDTGDHFSIDTFLIITILSLITLSVTFILKRSHDIY